MSCLLEVKQHDGSFYSICVPCSRKLSQETVLAHLQSLPHIKTYATNYMPDGKSKYKDISKDQAATFHSFLQDMKKHEKEIGRGKIASCLESEKSAALKFLRSVTSTQIREFCLSIKNDQKNEIKENEKLSAPSKESSNTKYEKNTTIENKEKKYSVMLSNLPSDWDKGMFRGKFKSFGRIHSTNYLAAKNLSYVNYFQEGSCQRAVDFFNKRNVNGKTITAKIIYTNSDSTKKTLLDYLSFQSKPSRVLHFSGHSKVLSHFSLIDNLKKFGRIGTSYHDKDKGISLIAFKNSKSAIDAKDDFNGRVIWDSVITVCFSKIGIQNETFGDSQQKRFFNELKRNSRCKSPDSAKRLPKTSNFDEGLAHQNQFNILNPDILYKENESPGCSFDQFNRNNPNYENTNLPFQNDRPLSQNIDQFNHGDSFSSQSGNASSYSNISVNEWSANLRQNDRYTRGDCSNKGQDDRYPRGTRNNEQQDDRHPRRTKTKDQQGDRYPKSTNTNNQQGDRYPKSTNTNDQQGDRYPKSTNTNDQQVHRYPRDTSNDERQGESYPRGKSTDEKSDMYSNYNYGSTNPGLYSRQEKLSHINNHYPSSSTDYPNRNIHDNNSYQNNLYGLDNESSFNDNKYLSQEASNNSGSNSGSNTQFNCNLYSSTSGTKFDYNHGNSKEVTNVSLSNISSKIDDMIKKSDDLENSIFIMDVPKISRDELNLIFGSVKGFVELRRYMEILSIVMLTFDKKENAEAASKTFNGYIINKSQVTVHRQIPWFLKLSAFEKSSRNENPKVNTILAMNLSLSESEYQLGKMYSDELNSILNDLESHPNYEIEFDKYKEQYTANLKESEINLPRFFQEWNFFFSHKLTKENKRELNQAKLKLKELHRDKNPTDESKEVEKCSRDSRSDRYKRDSRDKKTYESRSTYRDSKSRHSQDRRDERKYSSSSKRRSSSPYSRFSRRK